jgi:bacterial Ig-like domain (group 2)./bacterial Ig-like domain (group 3)
MKRRILALLLTLVMLVGMIPTSVFADEAAQETISAPVEETEAPVLETEAPQTQPPVTEAPETEAPETQAPTQAPETEAPATEAPETQAPTEETEETLDVMAEAADPVTVSFTVSQQGVLAKTSDGTAAVELPVTVTDVNSDGILTFDEALVALHEAYCPDGYALNGNSVRKLWGSEVTAPIVAKNDKVLEKAVNWKTSTVAEGDKLYAASIKDTVDYSDCLSYFDKKAVTVEAGKEFTLTLKAAGEYFSGSNYKELNAYSIPVGTWENGSFKAITGAKTAANGTVTLSFAKAGTYIVTASGTLPGEADDGFDTYDVDCPVSAPYCIVTVKGSSVEPAANAEVTFTVGVKGVLATTSDGEAAIGLPVTVTDRNSDGILTYDEALVALHETYCPGGYEIVKGFVEKLWDVTTTPVGSYYFLKNNAALSMGVADKTSTVAQGDKLYCCVFTDEKNWSDAISYFTQTAVTAQAGKAFTLNLQGGSSMAVGGYKPGNLAGAQVGIWKDGKFTAIDGVVTDSKGNASLTLDKAGTYIISATGEIQTEIANWAGGKGDEVITVTAPLTAPYCVVTVTGSVVTYATVTFSYQEAGNQEVFAFDEKIASNLAESYGYTDHVVGAVSALDVLVRAHELTFFDQFTPDNATDFLAISDANWVTKRMGEESTNLAILVNGKQAADDKGTGLFVNQTKVVDGDYVTFGVYEDAAYYLDKYIWLETADGKPLTGQTFYANTDLDLVVKSNYAAYGDPVEVVEGAQLATMDMKTGKVEAVTGKISDKDGKISLHIPEELANKKSCFVITGVDEAMTALNVFQVGDVLKETDLVEVHLGIGSSENTIRELTLNPTFVHNTMDYTVEPLDFVEEEAARRLWVKVEYIPYCTAGFNFHGVTKTFTAEQNRKWVRLDKLVPGAEASVLTLTSTAKGGFDKTYTVTVSMEKGKALLWKTDLTGEALTIGQNTQNTLTVEAGYTKDVTDSPAISYQWYVNTTASTEGGKAVAGATEATLTIPSDTLGTFYYYAVASSTGLESATSKIVEVTVKAVPKSLSIVTDYPYTVPSTSAMAIGGVTNIANQGTQFHVWAVDENGEKTPVTWVAQCYGGKFDAETGTYTVNSTSYSYLTATSTLDPSVSTPSNKALDVAFFKFSDKAPTVKLSVDGQSVKTASLYGGANGHTVWDVKIPDGVAKVTSDLSTKPNNIQMDVLRPGKVEVTMTLDVGPEDAPLTDKATVTVTGVAVENADGELGKAYLELTSENKAPTMQLKALTEEGRTVASWKSANEAVATVDENGVVTAHAVGTSQITVTDDKGTKGGILVVVTDAQNPTFENLVLFGITTSTFKYNAGQKAYTGIKLNSYTTTTLTINKGTLYDSKKLDCVATYTNESGEAVSIAIPSATQTMLPGFPFGTTVVTLTLTDKENKDVKSEYTLEVTRPRDTTKTLGTNNAYSRITNVGLFDTNGEALSTTQYLSQAEGYLFRASNAGVKNSTYGWTNSHYYYRAFMQNGRADFTALLKGQTVYTHVRYSTDDGATWKELAQGGGSTDVIAFPEAEEGKNAEVKLTVQIVCDDAYFTAGNAFPEMTANGEKLMLNGTQVGTTYTFWVEQLPVSGEPKILTATSDGGEWYPAFNDTSVSYRLSIAQEDTLPTVTFTVAEGCTVKLGSKALTADENGNYTLALTTASQKLNVTLGSLTRVYDFSASKRIKNGADKLVDYLCINSQYTNAGYGLGGEAMLSGSLKSLGNFGGYATFYFENGLKNDPTNQYGVDFYITGNSNAGGSFPEPGQVWVSEDGNTWYALAGSQHYTNAIWDYTVTYTKNGTGTSWKDNYGHTSADHGKTFNWPLASNYTLNDVAESDTYTVTGVLIPSIKGMIGDNTTASWITGTSFGYVDATPNGEENPYLANDDLSLKSSGFDLAWAVDGNGIPVNVNGMSFHYVKVVTAANVMAGAFYEKSTEIAKVYRATSTGASVGQTPAPTAITFSDGTTNYTLTPVAGQQTYELTLPMKSASISVAGGAENIYVNDQRIASDAATKAIDITKDNTLVRVIVQSGDMEPTIYLLRLTSRESTEADLPVITTQPVSAIYRVGDDMTALSVEAEVEGTYKKLSYQWYVTDTAPVEGQPIEGATAIEGATEATYELGKAVDGGTKYYFCTVTNAVVSQYSVNSDVAAITVKTDKDIIHENLTGTGTEADPYEITSGEDYAFVAQMVKDGYSFSGEYLAQTEDVTLPEGWEPIGVLIDPSVGHINNGKNMRAFSGHLDGKGNTLTVPEGGLPLFGYVKDAYVSDLNIYGTRIEGYGLVNNYEGVGLSGNAVTIDHVTLKSGTKSLKSGLIGTYITNNGFAGCSGGYTVTIRNCVAEEGVVIGYDGTQSQIGTFAGRFNGTIENCVSYATVKGVKYVGGIGGTQDNSMYANKYLNCTFGGTVEATGELAGGIVGGGYPQNSAPNAIRANIIGCKVTGSVTGSDKVGGIEGGNDTIVQTYANGPFKFQNNTFAGTVTATNGTVVGSLIGYLQGLSKYDYISGNTSYTKTLPPIGRVEYVDTNAAEHENVIGQNYVNTEKSTAGLPKLDIPWFSWKKGFNRTDDLLGANADTMCNTSGGSVPETVDSELVGGKSTKLSAVDVETGKTIPASSITWALENPDDAAYATVTADGTVKSYVVASKHDVTFLGALKNGYSGFVMHTITIYPPVSLVEIHSGDKNVTGETLYLNGVEGAELALTAKLYPTDGKEGITWKSSNTKVLTVEDGTVRYVAGTGTVTVTATANDGSKKSASVKVQVGLLTQSVTITEPETTVLRSGKSLTLKATTEPVKPTVSGVTFQLVNSADSVYATVAANGKVTAKTVNEPHAVQVVAASKDGQAKSEPITLTILPKSNQTLILKSGTDYVTKTTLIRNIGETIALKAYTLDVSSEVPSEVEAENVTWKSSKTKVATVDETGKIECLAKGKATISALVDGKVQATVTVSVTTLVESLTIGSKTGSFTLASGKKLNLTAAAAPAEAANKAVTWAITEGSEYAKISGSGVVTANKNLTVPVTVTVQAAAKDGSGVTAQQEITVNPLSYGVEIKRPNASENTTLVWDMADRNVIQLSAKVYPLSAEQSVTWKSSNARVASIDASGKITCLKAGTVTITATANDGSGKKASFKLQIVKLMKSLGLQDISVAGGKSVTLKPLIGPADTTNKKLAWSVSENKYGIKINGSGKVSTKAVTEPVNVTVTASALDGSGVSTSCEVTVYPATTKVTISAKDGKLPASISVDTTLELTASSQPAGTKGTYTWKSSNEKIAAVDANGVVTAIKAGKVKITCTAADGTNKSASVTLKIVEAIETPPKL